MSTGANCTFRERTPGQWFYLLQCYPYGATEDYDESGPFKTFREAYEHLHKHNANPGGFSVDALPGCKHDMTKPLPTWMIRHEGDYTHDCDRCGAALRIKPNGKFA